MIRVIGLSKYVYGSILEHNSHIVRNCDDKINMIEFIPQCALDFQNGMITIEHSDSCVAFLCCDFWRIEIE